MQRLTEKPELTDGRTKDEDAPSRHDSNSADSQGKGRNVNCTDYSQERVGYGGGRTLSWHHFLFQLKLKICI